MRWFSLASLLFFACDDDGGAADVADAGVCDEVTRCPREQLCRFSRGIGGRCVASTAPIGEQCVTVDDCGFDAYVTCISVHDEPPTCEVGCIDDVECPLGFFCNCPFDQGCYVDGEMGGLCRPDI